MRRSPLLAHLQIHVGSAKGTVFATKECSQMRHGPLLPGVKAFLTSLSEGNSLSLLTYLSTVFCQCNCNGTLPSFTYCQCVFTKFKCVLSNSNKIVQARQTNSVTNSQEELLLCIFASEVLTNSLRIWHSLHHLIQLHS